MKQKTLNPTVSSAGLADVQLGFIIIVEKIDLLFATIVEKNGKFSSSSKQGS